MANAKLNIGDANGFGLEYIFRGQCRWTQYKGNDCLLINGPDTGYKDKIVIFAGGAASDSYKKSEVTHTVCGLQPRSTCIMTTPSKRHSTDNWQPRTENLLGLEPRPS